MEDFIYSNFLQPILDKTGYNPVNTAVYAATAMLALYCIFLAFKKYQIKVDRAFSQSILFFVLFGSTVRVVTDSIDGGVFTAVTPIHKLVLDSHVYDYSLATVTPGIYIVTAAIFFLSLIILRKLGKEKHLAFVGIALWLPHFLLLLPFMKYFTSFFPVIILAVIPAYLTYRYLKDDLYSLMVAGHAFDGAATFWVIDVFGPSVGKKYFEQHVVGGFIGEFFQTFFVFYLLKVAVSAAIAYYLSKEKDEDQEMINFVVLAITIMGFAPGIRDVLRMMAGA